MPAFEALSSLTSCVSLLTFFFSAELYFLAFFWTDLVFFFCAVRSWLAFTSFFPLISAAYSAVTYCIGTSFSPTIFSSARVASLF